MKNTILVSLSLMLLSTCALPAIAETLDSSTKAEVPALAAFHEVIAPLWHDAWPSRNVPMLQGFVPQIRLHVEAIRVAKLPGILHEKQEAWDAGVKALAETAAGYEVAATAGQEQALLDAAERLHSQYEQLVRVVRPAMKELDAYHVALYDLYHRALPSKAVEDIAKSAPELQTRCVALAAAPTPRRFASIEPRLKPAVTELCRRTDALKAATAAGSGVEAAALAVHDEYQTVAALFE